MIRTPVRAAAAALLLVALAGCSSGSHPVAKVGDRTLTVDDFVARASGASQMPPGSPEQVKALLLQDIVRRELVIDAARRHGYDTLAAARQFESSNRTLAVLNTLYAQFASTDIGVSEAEVKALYDKRAMQADASVIYATERDLLVEAQRRLAAGASFNEVASQINPPNTLPPGGALGGVRYGDLFPPLDGALLTQAIGAVGGPYASPKGWFLLLVTKRTANPQASYEAVRSQLENMIRTRRVQQAQADAQVALEAEYHLQVNLDGVKELFRFIAPARDGSAEHWMPNDQERQTPLATFAGGAYTLGDAADDLINGTSNSPDARVFSSCVAWAREQGLRRIALAEAKRRHIAEEPSLHRDLQTRIEQNLIEAEVNNVTAGVVPPSPAEAKALWDQVKAMYPQVRSAHVQWIATTDTTVLRTLAAPDLQGKTLAEALKTASPGVVVHDEMLHYPTADPYWGQLQPMLAQMPLGALSNPLQAEDGMRVVQLLERDASPLDWEQLPPAVQENVTRTALQRAQQQRLSAWVDSLWKAANPVLMPENLKRVRLPEASALEGM